MACYQQIRTEHSQRNDAASAVKSHPTPRDQLHAKSGCTVQNCCQKYKHRSTAAHRHISSPFSAQKKNTPVRFMQTEGVHKRGTTSGLPIYSRISVSCCAITQPARYRAHPGQPYCACRFRRRLRGVFTKCVSLPFTKRKFSLQAETLLLFLIIADGCHYTTLRRALSTILYIKKMQKR